MTLQHWRSFDVLKPSFGKIAVWCALAALASSWLMSFRVSSVVRDGRWAETSGLEGISVSIALRIALGGQAYNDLALDSTAAVYNFGFYYLYAAVARMISDSPTVQLLGMRLTSLGAFVMLAIVIVVVARSRFERLGAKRWTWPLAVSAAVALAFHPFVGWWALTVRPDAIAVVAEVVGVLLTIRAVRGKSTRGTIAAAFAYAIALSFRQNAVACLMVSIGVNLLLKRWTHVLALSVAVPAAAIAGLVIGGPHYLSHVIHLARNTPYSAANVTLELGKALQVGVGVLAPAVCLALEGIRKSHPSRAILAHAFLASLLLGVALLARVGASRNYLLTAFLLGGLLVLCRADHLRRSRLIMAVALAGVVYHTLVVLMYFPPFGMGRATLRSDPVLLSARASDTRAEPDPIFIETVWESLPWLSGREQGLEAFDSWLYPSAVTRGAIPASVEDRIRRRYYTALFVRSSSFRVAAERAGYQSVSQYTDGVVHLRRAAGP